MKNILLSFMVVVLVSSSLSVTATDREPNATPQDNHKPKAYYPLPANDREIGQDKQDIDTNSRDEYREPDGNIPETQPIDKSKLPPS